MPVEADEKVKAAAKHAERDKASLVAANTKLWGNSKGLSCAMGWWEYHWRLQDLKRRPPDLGFC